MSTICKPRESAGDGMQATLDLLSTALNHIKACNLNITQVNNEQKVTAPYVVRRVYADTRAW